MRSAIVAGLLAAWAGSGCLWFKQNGPPEVPAPVQEHKKDGQRTDKPAAPVVTADQITEVNARDVAEALRKELDREAQQAVQP